MKHAAWSRLGLPGKVAVVAGALAALVLVLSLPALAAAWLTPRPAAQEPPTGPAGSAAERLKTQLAQVDGRSLFFVPAAPPPPPPPPPKDEGPRPTTRPSTYRGPMLVAMVNDTAWFGKDTGESGPNDKIVSVLTIGGPEIRGVKLLELNPPWSARVEWQGVEFDVPLLAPDTIVNKQPHREPPAPSTAAGGHPPAEYEGPPPPGQSQ